MKKKCGNSSADEACLKVFGALTASVTHEIKNTISIINENAGLLKDLCDFAEDESGVPVEHIDAAADKMMKQVERSDTILKNLNRFAHSGDNIPSQADLLDILSLMVALTSRFAAMQKVSIKLECPSGIEVRTNLLIFESLLFMTLRRMYSACPEDSTLKIAGEADGEQFLVKFMLVKGGTLECAHSPGIEEQILAAEVGAVCWSQEGEIIIKLAACRR
jgi:hypothetical protein